MTDISALQEQWQKEVTPLLESTKQDVYQSNNYAGDLEEIGERLGKAHGLSRLRIPFVKATKVSWLKHKRKKTEKRLEEEKGKLTTLVASTYSALNEKVAAESDYAAEYKFLNKAIAQIQETQNIIRKAAKKCRNASAAETVAAVDNGIPTNIRIGGGKNNQNAVMALALVFRLGTDLAAYTTTRRATKAFQQAEQAVLNLKQTLQQELPQVNGAMADRMSSGNDRAGMMDMLGGMAGTLASWDMATQLNDAKNHLRGVADQLGNTLTELSQNRQSLMETTLTHARKSEDNVKKFAAELENHMASTTTVESLKKAALEFQKPSL